MVYSVSPCARESYRGWVETELRYQLSQTRFSTQTGSGLPSFSSLLTSSSGTSGLSNSTEQDGHFSVGTGEQFGRLNSQLAVDTTYSDYTPSQPTFSRVTEAITTKYAISRVYTIITKGGYENLNAQNFIYMGPLWSLGVDVHPNPVSSVSVSYGKYDGFSGFTGKANYEITAATKLFASYNESVQTTQTAIVQNLNATGTLPVNFPVVNPNFSLQNDLFRSKVLEAGATNSSLSRNSFTTVLDYEVRDSLTGLSPNDSVLSGSLVWNHEISPQAGTIAALGYSKEAIGRTSTTNASLGYNYTFNETLKGSLRYDFVMLDSNLPGTKFLQNAFTISVRKSF